MPWLFQPLLPAAQQLSGGVNGVGESSQAQTTSAIGSAPPAAVTGTISTSQAQTVALAGNSSIPAAVSGTASTSQAQIVDLAGSNTSPAAVSGIVSTSQAQSVECLSDSQSVGSHSGEVVLQRKRVYIKRDKQYLIFNTLAEADSYVAAEEAIETARQSSRGAARRKVKALNVPKPEVVQAVEPEKLEVMLERFNLPFNLSAAISKEDFAALHYIQEQLAIMQDDEDIELLLLTL